MVKFFKKHWEVLSYLIFGVLTTLLNIVLYALFNNLFGYTAANSWGNVLDNILCILFAYATNRAFVFRSRTRPGDGEGVRCIRHLPPGHTGAGCRHHDGGRQPAGRAGHSSDGRPDAGRAGGCGGLDQSGHSCKHDQHLRRRRGSFCCHRHHRWCRWPDGDLRQRLQRTDFVGLCVKVFSNVVVVVLNYVFSKLIIFKKKK